MDIKMTSQIHSNNGRSRRLTLKPTTLIILILQNQTLFSLNCSVLSMTPITNRLPAIVQNSIMLNLMTSCDETILFFISASHHCKSCAVGYLIFVWYQFWSAHRVLPTAMNHCQWFILCNCQWLPMIYSTTAILQLQSANLLFLTSTNKHHGRIFNLSLISSKWFTTTFL